MSTKSTPIAQLQSISPVNMQSIPEAEATINDMAMEFGQPSMPPMMLAANTQPASITANPGMQVHAQTGLPLISNEDAKIFLAATFVYILLSNDAVTQFLAKKVPGMSNPFISLIARAATAGVLLALINKVM